MLQPIVFSPTSLYPSKHLQENEEYGSVLDTLFHEFALDPSLSALDPYFIRNKFSPQTVPGIFTGIKISRKNPLPLFLGSKRILTHSYIFLERDTHWLLYLVSHSGSSHRHKKSSSQASSQHYFEGEPPGLLGTGKTGVVKGLQLVATSLTEEQARNPQILGFSLADHVLLKRTAIQEMGLGEIETLKRLNLLVGALSSYNPTPKAYVVMKKVFGVNFNQACAQMPNLASLLRLFCNVIEVVHNFQRTIGQQHQDIHSGNVLVDLSTNQVQLIDFQRVKSARDINALHDALPVLRTSSTSGNTQSSSFAISSANQTGYKTDLIQMHSMFKVQTDLFYRRIEQENGFVDERIKRSIYDGALNSMRTYSASHLYFKHNPLNEIRLTFEKILLTIERPQMLI